MYGVKLPDSAFKTLAKTHTGPVYVIRFNSTGEYAMTGSEDRGVCLYNPSKNLMIKHYRNLHNYDVSGLDIAKDNSKFATGGGDKNIILSDTVEGKTVRKYTGHSGRVNSVAFNSESSVIVSTSYDTTVRCWDNRANSYTPIDIIKGFRDSVSNVIIRGFEIICSSMDGTVRFYDVRLGQFVSDELGEGIQSMAVAHSNRAYIASALDSTIYLIERSSGHKVIDYRGHNVQNFTINCKFNEEDSHIFSGSTDGKLYIYDILKSQPCKVVNVSSSPLSALDVHSEGGLIAGTHDGNIVYWKL
jgi:mitogen-activated protein kinase organizer 1